jgi:hypothetical protein
MTPRSLTLIAAIVLATTLVHSTPAPSTPAAEYATHFGALTKLSIAVAEAMPPDQYSFRPHPESMDFGQLMSHIATTNYQFCAGLKDTDPPTCPRPPAKPTWSSFSAIPSTIAPRSSRP